MVMIEITQIYDMEFHFLKIILYTFVSGSALAVSVSLYANYSLRNPQ